MTIQSPPQCQTFELVCEDDQNMDDAWHCAEMYLLIDSTHQRFRGRTDYFTHGNIFVYYSMKQARAILEEEAATLRARESGTEDPPKTTFRGPDYFCVLGVDGKRERDAWVVWEEDGRYPDIIIELVSEKTRKNDLGSKKDLYEKTFRTLEYICYDPKRDVLQGWRLVDGVYRPIEPDGEGKIQSTVLEASLGRWQGVFHTREHLWIRLFEPDGRLVEIGDERAERERDRAEQERDRAEQEKLRADEAEAELARLQERLRQIENDPDG